MLCIQISTLREKSLWHNCIKTKNVPGGASLSDLLSKCSSDFIILHKKKIESAMKLPSEFEQS